MKIKRRTEVTIVTHEVTLLRIQDDEADGDASGDVRAPKNPLAFAEEKCKGEEHETEKNDS